MFSYNHFAFGVNQSVGETVIAYALTGARWSVLAWDWYTEAFFSPTAKARYEWVGQMIACLGMLIYPYGKRLWDTVQRYFDQQIKDHQEIEENDQPVASLSSATSQDILSEPVSPVTTNESDDLDRLKAQARALKIKGWNLYKSPEKLEEKIRQHQI